MSDLKPMRCNLSLLVVTLLFIAMPLTVSADSMLVRHIQPEGANDQRNEYYLAMLQLALEKSRKKFGGYQLEKVQHRMLQGRAIASLAKKELVDVVWTMTSSAREETLRPIRIPLLKGLLGYRVFLIRTRDQSKFGKITSLDNLKSLLAGQGHDWPDTSILEANGLPVITSAYYDGLFAMLKAGRFDYFPRGVNEAWLEVRNHKESGLMVEENLLLQYPTAIYFFVHHDNYFLADRIEAGLELAIADGSFDRLFRQHESNKKVFGNVEIEKRRIFTLHNPSLPSETPLEKKHLWYKPARTDTNETDE